MRNKCLSQLIFGTIGSACIIGLLAAAGSPARAAPLSSGASRMGLPSTLLDIVQKQDLVYARAAARGPRGGAVARGPRGTAARGPQGNVAVRPGYRPPVPARGWSRPPSYWWRPGAAVAAGAALGFVTAAAATAYATSPAPAAGYCWFYTNPQRTQGFWDVCPQ